MCILRSLWDLVKTSLHFYSRLLGNFIFGWRGFKPRNNLTVVVANFSDLYSKVENSHDYQFLSCRYDSRFLQAFTSVNIRPKSVMIISVVSHRPNALAPVVAATSNVERDVPVLSRRRLSCSRLLLLLINDRQNSNFESVSSDNECSF